jgi:hypothetical protein
MDGIKVRVYLLSVEKGERLSMLMITCNKDGTSLSKGVVPKILQSLELKE